MKLYSNSEREPLEYPSLGDAKKDGWYETLDFGPHAKGADYFALDRHIQEVSKKFFRQHTNPNTMRNFLCAVCDVFKEQRSCAPWLHVPKEIGCWAEGHAVTLLFRE